MLKFAERTSSTAFVASTATSATHGTFLYFASSDARVSASTGLAAAACLSTRAQHSPACGQTSQPPGFFSCVP